MKIYVGHSNSMDYKNELYTPLRKSNINLDHTIILPHEIFEEAKDFITKDIIKNSDLFIAEISLPSTGLWIELWIANTFSVPISCIYKKWNKISWSLKVICNDFIEYTDKNDMIDKIEKYLKTKIK